MSFAGEIDGKLPGDHIACTHLTGPDGELLQKFPHRVTPVALAAAIRSHLHASD